MHIISKSIEQYCQDHTSPESENLVHLNRETHLKTIAPQMLSGHLQGKFLEFISLMIKPDYILEIGTFTGYSAICLAKGLQKTGKLITIDINEELNAMAKKYISAEKMEHTIELFTGDALKIIPQLKYTFDLVFIDANKLHYAQYFDAVLPHVKIGGWIVCDNVLWAGKVLRAEKDKDTAAIDAFNKKILEDKRVENIILPLRDGISIARKIG